MKSETDAGCGLPLCEKFTTDCLFMCQFAVNTCEVFRFQNVHFRVVKCVRSVTRV
ncbi:hypothetical protein KUF71_003958 [Frankliniella fusca]|uniref:Uncharacterized protein n=1 Tax=Frankliniella fusca TaxID=407009 RepID=A0AAE1L7R2_9NEOP|nr:hypothetical protein KUF71_003958 [Frankliniella fusca]